MNNGENKIKKDIITTLDSHFNVNPHFVINYESFAITLPKL